MQHLKINKTIIVVITLMLILSGCTLSSYEKKQVDSSEKKMPAEKEVVNSEEKIIGKKEPVEEAEEIVKNKPTEGPGGIPMKDLKELCKNPPQPWPPSCDIIPYEKPKEICIKCKELFPEEMNIETSKVPETGLDLPPLMGQIYGTYPDTEEAPVLEFFWEGELDLDTVTRVTPYGPWEGWKDTERGVAHEPAVEMQFYVSTLNKPIYAVASGIVIDKSNEHKMLTVSYGKNYGITYHHIDKIPDNIKPGLKIEAGELVGYTEDRLNPDEGWEGWWEIELDVKKGDGFRSVPPYNYFSEKSKKKLDAILESSKNWNVKGSPKTWTVKEGCTWTKYFEDPEWWTSPIRVGYVGLEGESLKDFLKKNDLSWEIENEEGRVIGPKDDCR